MNLSLRAVGAMALALTALGIAVTYAYSGTFGFNVILRRGASIWMAVTPDDQRLSPAIRLALLPEPPDVTAGPFAWRALQPGLEVAELPVIAATGEVDRILLARLSPRAFRFEVINEPAGHLDLEAWMKRTGASVIVNGSYYSLRGEPVTPVVAQGRALGPKTYTARHGVFVADPAMASVRDLATTSWEVALASASNGLVSFPLLLGADGQSRTGAADRRWLANRSFVGQDRTGRIVIGTTQDGFFSLDRLGAFLRTAPLDLETALNLDGGPLACQAVAAAGYTRRFCGDWETQVRGGELHLLGRVFGERPWGLPLVLAAFPR